MEKFQTKGKVEKFNSYSKLLNCLKEDSSSEEIEEAVNKIIDDDMVKIKGLRSEIRRRKYQKENLI